MFQKNTRLTWIALMTAILSFSLTLAAYAAASETWPATCGDAKSYGPGGTAGPVENPNSPTQPLTPHGDRIAACRARCDQNCGEPLNPTTPNPNSAFNVYKRCCANYNDGNSPGKTHCLGAGPGVQTIP